MTGESVSSKLDLAALRCHAGGRGRRYWSSLEELAQSPDFVARLREEFPASGDTMEPAWDRRRFLQLAAASLALTGVAGCGPEEAPRDRQPYVEQPPGIVPGRARYYATATALQGFGAGVLVEHQMGRPIKVEGNPDHPASLGATSAIGQASILGLYDPYRAQTLTRDGGIVTWETFVAAAFARRDALLAKKGRGLALLTGTVTSPTLAAQIARLKKDFPELRWHQWEAINRDEVLAGARLAFGRPLDLIPDFTAADVVVAIDSDALDRAPGHLKFARDFAARRRAVEMRERMSRVYALESTPTLIGAKADHRLAMGPAEIERALRQLAAKLGAAPQEWSAGDHPAGTMIEAIVDDLRGAKGRALVHVGASQPAALHATAHAINEAIGAFGKTVSAIDWIAAEAQDQRQSLADLSAAMAKGEIDTLLILAANPIFTAPADLDFASALQKVPFSIYLGEHDDETAAAVHWHVPQTHEYEAWSDVRAFDGTATIQQPQMKALGERRSAHELLALFAGETTPHGRDILIGQWQEVAKESGAQDFASFWTAALQRGVVPDTAAKPVDVAVRHDLAAQVGHQGGNREGEGIVILFRPDEGLWDGRFAENGWLQELPRPLTRLTWDNAALIAPRTAERLGLATSDLVEISVSGRAVRAPVWVLPGEADDCVTLPLGFGRRRVGPVGEGVGFDAYSLRPQDALWQVGGATIKKVDGKYQFAVIQHEAATHDRDVVREGSLADFLRNPEFLQHRNGDESLYPGYAYDGIAWAMSINLNACIGCQACVVACQAENNGPIVGKTEVFRGRDMHWLRIDRYYAGALDDPKIVFQPVPCMHCENAPCEVVCPVHATVHDSEGLNVMVYNRCVGTRFCSNNCPYKVRRFNFFDYTGPDRRPRESWNPEVTVRGRGVMEKCTYCIQRTRAAMIDADRENRRLRDGEVMTACQQACPTQAITFGDKNDKESAVAKRKSSPLDYAMLDDLNTRPRTSYEALIRNPKSGIENA
jgi:MoCo/4Fe-4S cofactor protein with predicted Tat translocation signal